MHGHAFMWCHGSDVVVHMQRAFVREQTRCLSHRALLTCAARARGVATRARCSCKLCSSAACHQFSLALLAPAVLARLRWRRRGLALRCEAFAAPRMCSCVTESFFVSRLSAFMATPPVVCFLSLRVLFVRFCFGWGVRCQSSQSVLPR